jgi:hypothetical protein
MSKKKKITIIQDNSGDWMGIYIDGKLEAENHSYDATDMMDILDIEYEEHWIDMEDSRLPATLAEIKLPEKEPDGEGT